MKYDPGIIEQHARTFYRQADSIELQYLIVGVFLGLMLGAPLAYIFTAMAPFNFVGAVLLVMLCGYLGKAVGKERSFHLRLKAQLIMQKVRAEENTHRIAVAMERLVSAPGQSEAVHEAAPVALATPRPPT